MKKEDTLAIDMTDAQWRRFRLQRRLMDADDYRNGLVTETDKLGGFIVECLLIPTEEELIEEAIAHEEFGGMVLDECRKLGKQKRSRNLHRQYPSCESQILFQRGMLDEVLDRVYDRPFVHYVRGYRKLS